jgi:hypothetical protein
VLGRARGARGLARSLMKGGAASILLRLLQAARPLLVPDFGQDLKDAPARAA